MYLSRVLLSAREVGVAQLAKLESSGGYGAHQQLWRLFGDDADHRRDFLYRRDLSCRFPSFLILSSRRPRDVDRLWSIETKDYDPGIQEGSEFRFLLRANPVRTRRVGAEKRHARHDVVMNAKRTSREMVEGSGDHATDVDLIHDAGFDWLQGKAQANGFAVAPHDVAIDGYRQHRLWKSGGRQIRFSTLEFSGRLTAEDPEPFRKALLTGVGPAKSFGCGLLLIKRL